MSAFVVQLSVSHGGAPKNPVLQARVTKLGFEGDYNRCRDRKGDPGNLRAILLYPIEYIAWLKEQGFPVYPGALGENITMQGIDFRSLRFGDRFCINDVELEVCKTRTPCIGIGHFGGQKLLDAIWEPDAKTNPASPKWGHSGFFAKVLHEGVVRKGDPIVLLARAQTMLESVHNL